MGRKNKLFGRWPLLAEDPWSHAWKAVDFEEQGEEFNFKKASGILGSHHKFILAA